MINPAIVIIGVISGILGVALNIISLSDISASPFRRNMHMFLALAALAATIIIINKA
jgi:hypothetical protein